VLKKYLQVRFYVEAVPGYGGGLVGSSLVYAFPCNTAALYGGGSASDKAASFPNNW
jgi:hypothetical protein